MQITFPAEQIKGHFKNFSGNFPQNATIKPWNYYQNWNVCV